MATRLCEQSEDARDAPDVMRTLVDGLQHPVLDIKHHQQEDVRIADLHAGSSATARKGGAYVGEEGREAEHGLLLVIIQGHVRHPPNAPRTLPLTLTATLGNPTLHNLLHSSRDCVCWTVYL